MSTKQLQKRIRTLLKERHAVLLAHNYQRSEIQDVADMTGDSLGLSIQAGNTDAEMIVFCGVHFMAETAAIVCPDKTVLLPRPDAGCPMADTITAASLQARKKELPACRWSLMSIPRRKSKRKATSAALRQCRGCGQVP